MRALCPLGGEREADLPNLALLGRPFSSSPSPAPCAFPEVGPAPPCVEAGGVSPPKDPGGGTIGPVTALSGELTPGGGTVADDTVEILASPEDRVRFIDALGPDPGPMPNPSPTPAPGAADIEAAVAAEVGFAASPVAAPEAEFDCDKG